ncbi:YlxR family protein [Jatrophihabitans sp. DSM 45814]
MAVNPLGAVSLQRVVIRTCIGCRQRATATELLRVVADPAVGAVPVSPVQICPDPRRCAPGRGAWIHPNLECVTFAERRRAFGRALRCTATTDPTPVREYVSSLFEAPSAVATSAGDL